MIAPPRILRATERVARLRVSGALFALFVVAAFLNPERPLPVELCLLKALTGLSCPTCGLTRAVCHALHGDLAGSIGFHPAGILVVVSGAGSILWSFIEAVRGRALWLGAQKPLAKLAGASIALISLLWWILQR